MLYSKQIEDHFIFSQSQKRKRMPIKSSCAPVPAVSLRVKELLLDTPESVRVYTYAAPLS